MNCECQNRHDHRWGHAHPENHRSTACRAHIAPGQDPTNRQCRDPGQAAAAVLASPVPRKPGGQPGHEGTTLDQVADPDQIIRHEPAGCGRCGSDLADAEQVGCSRRQVFDIPPITVRVVEHRSSPGGAPAGGSAKVTRPPGYWPPPSTVRKPWPSSCTCSWASSYPRNAPRSPCPNRSAPPCPPAPLPPRPPAPQPISTSSSAKSPRNSSPRRW